MWVQAVARRVGKAVCELAYAALLSVCVTEGEILAATLPPPFDIALGALVPAFSALIAAEVTDLAGC